MPSGSSFTISIVLSDAIVLPRSCFFLWLYFSVMYYETDGKLYCAWSSFFSELGQAHNYIIIIIIIIIIIMIIIIIIIIAKR